MKGIAIDSPQSMFTFGQTLAWDSHIILLEWELGTGKTTLIKWFASELGINPHSVNSPTYTYMQSYEGKLLHIDMYNITSFDELIHKWIIDQIHKHEYIAIERPKFVDQLWLHWWSLVRLEKKDSHTRTAFIESF
jgi:tRNA threonylcarbamoyladenosine biosynthesis protein TsaE